MDAVTFAVLFAVLLSSGHGSIDGVLRRMQLTASTEELLLARCLESIAKSYRYSHYELEILILNEDFDESTFWKHWDRLTFDAGITLGRFITVHVLKGHQRVEKVLRKLNWKRLSLFVVVLKRSGDSDRFFVDLPHQGTDFDVVTEGDLRKDFSGLFSPNETQHMRNMRRAFRKFWSARITDVIILVPRKTNVYVYSYFPFTERNCPDGISPVLTNVWFSGPGKFYRAHDLFPNKVNNVNLCPINVSLILNPPGVMAEKGTIDGIEGELIKFIFHFLNATPKFHFVNPQEVSFNDSETAQSFLLQNIINGDSDFGAGFLIPTSAYNDCTDDIYVGISLCLTWAVPFSLKHNENLHPIIDIFTDYVWKVVFCTALTSALILKFLLRSKERGLYSKSAFQIIAMILGKPVTLPRDKPPKSFVVFFIWFSLILGSAFQAGLGSNNIISRPPVQYQTTREILESGFEIVGADSTVHLFKNNIRLRRNNGANVPVEAMDIHNAMVKVAFERRTAYIGLRLAISYYVQFLNPELMDHIYVQRSCLVNYQPFFALRKNSPFTPRIFQLMFSVTENGIKGSLEQKYLSRLSRYNRRRRVGSKGDVLARGSLTLVGLGLWVSILVFMGECAFQHIQQCLKRIRTRASTGTGRRRDRL